MPVSADELALPDMLRMLDVARSMRQSRETVDTQFAVNDVKAQIRERLLKAAHAAGEAVTQAEIDTAIQLYFDRLYTYAEPPFGVRTAWAHAYVRRSQIVLTTVLTLAIGGGTWAACEWWWGRAHRESLALERQIVARCEQVSRLARGETAVAVSDQLANWRRETEAYRSQQAPRELRRISDEVAQLQQQLEAEYIIEVEHHPQATLGVEREFTDAQGSRVSGYYIVVHAHDANGQPRRLEITSAETGKTQSVATWAERVSKDVFERLAADKQEDGLLQETMFCSKRRGELRELVHLRGANGQPVERTAQLLNWDQ